MGIDCPVRGRVISWLPSITGLAKAMGHKIQQTIANSCTSCTESKKSSSGEKITEKS